jgi:hypothetical protein
VVIEGDSLKLLDAEKGLVLKSTMSQNRTYKWSMPSDKMMCMSSTVIEDVDEL